MTTSHNKRIAKNTLFLYFRLLLIMGVNLYTSRVVLEELGVDDYGVFVVVGGVVLLISSLNSGMSSVTQRFLNYELGTPKSTLQSLRQVFSTSLTIHILIALIGVCVAETIGLWFVNSELNIPIDSKYSANIVYQTSIAIFFVSLIQSSFYAAIIAHEQMGLFAFISIVETFLKLAIAFSLKVIPAPKLAFYGLMLLGAQLLTTSAYIIICSKKFSECRLRCTYHDKLFKHMFSFAGWNMVGNMAWVAKGQGIGILLNIFFGPLLNAAKGIADQVSNAVISLVGNFQLAFNPQITKDYAANEIEKMELLTYRGIKFSCCLLWLISLPLLVNINPILHIWLVDVPEYASVFVILILIDTICNNLFGSPLLASITATGNIKNFEIISSLLLLAILPAAYFLLKIGFPPQSVFYLNILFNLLCGLVRYWFCRIQLNYSFKYFTHYVLVRVLGVIIISLPMPLYIYHLLAKNVSSTFIVLLISILNSLFFATVSIWLLGINKTERHTITLYLSSKFHRN